MASAGMVEDDIALDEAADAAVATVVSAVSGGGGARLTVVEGEPGGGPTVRRNSANTSANLASNCASFVKSK